MKLTTVLNAKKAMRALLFYSYWPLGVKKTFKESLASMDFKASLLANGISVKSLGDSLEFSKKGRKIIVFKEEGPFELLHVAKRFEEFFSIKGIEAENGVLDFTREVTVMGYRIRTNIGVLEFPLIDVYVRHHPLSKGDVVFDCGAFHGWFALYASKLVGPEGKIYCFEPDLKNAAILSGNLERNNIRNAVIVKKGIWKSEGHLSFFSDGNTTSSIAFNSNDKSVPTIEVISIPAFFREEKLKKLDFVKMDIEGAEIEAVEGCIEFLKNHEVDFGIASYHLRNGTETCHTLERLFKEIGYDAVTEATHTITTYAWPKGRRKG